MKNEQAVSPVIATILMVAITVVLAGVLYVWANSLAADQPESGTRNSYTADDAAASTSANTDDVLMSVRWQHAEDDLNWAFVVMKLSVGDSNFDCNTAGDDDCTIGQDGNDDALWETGEFLTLSESGADIANGATTISLYVTYRGTAVAGDDSVSVS
jgi:flagellin-like protein